MAELYEMTVDECLRLLQSHPTHVGRLGFTTEDGPTVLPVNYRVVGGEIVFHTDAGSMWSAAIMNERVAFEVDDVDPAWQEGWSVLVRGKAREVRDSEERAGLTELLRSWADRHSRTVAVTPASITGRRIV
ncbi:pyridoxamine 5'-phosphate oxidase family protein [Euzebya sp.]|uniref:pyridoxamine 5'-phosphate oxidase family protein n=1 Tax=Euzebya sp. TaxID=1971409 RepID=UPI003517AC59